MKSVSSFSSIEAKQEGTDEDTILITIFDIEDVEIIKR